MEDWDKVTVLRKKAPKAAQMRSESAVNQAIRTGQAVETQQKCEYRAGHYLAMSSAARHAVERACYLRS